MNHTLLCTQAFKRSLRHLPRQCSARSVHLLNENTEETDLGPEHKWGVTDNEERVVLDNLSRSVTPADILRLTRQLGGKEQGKLANITSVQIEYDRCIPTGRAVIHTNRGSPKSTAEALRGTQIATIPLRSFLRTESTLSQKKRTRGATGRAQAAERGTFDGSGPGAGVNARGQDVVIWGLPMNVKSDPLRNYLRKLGLVKNGANGEPACEVLQAQHSGTKRVSNVSKFLIRLKSPSEAQTLVRRLHMTYYMPDVWGKKFLMNAKVVY